MTAVGKQSAPHTKNVVSISNPYEEMSSQVPYSWENLLWPSKRFSGNRGWQPIGLSRSRIGKFGNGVAKGAPKGIFRIAVG